MSGVNTVHLGGRDWEVAPLNIVGLKVLGPRITLIGTSMEPESLDALVDAVYHGIKRRNPEITRELVEQEIDLLNMGEMSAAVARANTLERTEPPSGEAQPAQ